MDNRSSQLVRSPCRSPVSVRRMNTTRLNTAGYRSSLHIGIARCDNSLLLRQLGLTGRGLLPSPIPLDALVWSASRTEALSKPREQYIEGQPAKSWCGRIFVPRQITMGLRNAPSANGSTEAPVAAKSQQDARLICGHRYRVIGSPNHRVIAGGTEFRRSARLRLPATRHQGGG